MATVVIMPGGFHPFHAGHFALYNSARRVFPDAEVFVAATNDTSQRPFPFPIKEKLAKLAGVEPGHFVQVKSPFRAEEITKNFDPEKDRLIFVRSEKDANKPPQAGGVKKDGSPAYLQPLLGAKKLEPFARHAYMAYLPTVEFGGGMTSATEIRAEWPTLDEQGKLDRVASLYPAAQKNPRLAQTVVKMLDAAISGEQPVTEKKQNPYRDSELIKTQQFVKTHYPAYQDPEAAFDKWVQRSLKHSEQNDIKHDAVLKRMAQKIDQLSAKLRQVKQSDMDESHTVGYIQEEPDYIEEKWSEKYKRSINCANPRGFSQRAHCAGRKKK